MAANLRPLDATWDLRWSRRLLIATTASNHASKRSERVPESSARHLDRIACHQTPERNPFPDSIPGFLPPIASEGSTSVSWRGWLAFIALGIIWGIPYFFIKLAVQEISPFVVAWGRIMLATLILLTDRLAAWRAPPPRRSQGSSLRLRNGRVRNPIYGDLDR